MNKILIIGNQGYLGSCLTEYLIERGYDCRGIDTGFFESGKLLQPKPITTEVMDARFIDEGHIKGFDVVIVLAGISNDPFGHMPASQIYDPTRDYALKIASMCKKLGIKFLYPSSCSVYGAAMDESLLDETMTTNPQTPYSINKLQVEEGLLKLADDSFTPIALRLSTIYGMSSRIRFDCVINMLCGLALTTKKVTLNSNGEAWRPHLHIEDACQAFHRCIDWDINSGELIVLNVGRNEDNLKIIDVAKMIHQNVEGSKLTYLSNNHEDDPDNLIKDRKIQDGVDARTYKVLFDKINRVLPNFNCKWNVESGVKQLLNDLEHIELSDEIFNRKEFYRLQQIEFLHQAKKIDDDLYWIK
tara:strand:- start:426 stop:1499 length:1074 start_codon:yes stop_codon:yes gene_type:complete